MVFVDICCRNFNRLMAHDGPTWILGWLPNICRAMVTGKPPCVTGKRLVFFFTFQRKTSRDMLGLYPNSLSYVVILPAVLPCFFLRRMPPLEEPHRATGNDCHEAIGRAIVGAARTEQSRNLFRRDGLAVGSTGSTVKYAEVSIVTGGGYPNINSWMVFLLENPIHIWIENLLKYVEMSIFHSIPSINGSFSIATSMLVYQRGWRFP